MPLRSSGLPSAETRPFPRVVMNRDCPLLGIEAARFSRRTMHQKARFFLHCVICEISNEKDLKVERQFEVGQNEVSRRGAKTQESNSRKTVVKISDKQVTALQQ